MTVSYICINLKNFPPNKFSKKSKQLYYCLLYTSDAADDMQCVDLGGRRIIKKIFFKQKTAYEIMPSLVGSEMCIRDSPPTKPIIFPNTSNQNFEITILFNVFERSGNYVFKDKKSPHPSGQGL